MYMYIYIHTNTIVISWEESARQIVSVTKYVVPAFHFCR